MDTLDVIIKSLSAPTPQSLYSLGATLREWQAEGEADERALSLALSITSGFFVFLSDLEAKTTAEEYNRLAAMLDLAAVGSVALQNLLTEREQVLHKLLAGGLSESLMLMGSLQYIKAWEREARAIYEQAAWRLYEAYWELSLRGQPALPAAERRRKTEALVGPCLDAELDAGVKIVYIGRLFQFALLTALGKPVVKT